MAIMTEIKIYLANLGKYNEGILQGEWFTLPCDIEKMLVVIGVGRYDEEGIFHHGVIEVERGVPYYYEDWAIHDYEAPFKIAEYESLTELNRIAETMQGERGEEFAGLVEAADTMDDAFQIFETGNYRIYSKCEDAYDLGHEVITESGLFCEADEIISQFFDYQAYGNSLINNGNFTFIDDYCLEIY